ncbi:dihydrodipicolinate synthase family protein [Streptomyces sp. NPDC004134]|uniref:dihydrodipicolinate synthase family protein n=1 Tax=Streptomyces sp. NPDC004134 TaxID=3364691 RepID=UPI0036759BFD
MVDLADELRERLRGTVLPAVLTPMDERGVVDLGVLRDYAAKLDAAPVGGFAVWAHTGRGLYLSEADRVAVLRTWREATDKPLVAGAGVPRDVARGATLEEAEAAVEAMAVTAAGLGADAVMVYPLSALAGRAGREGRAGEADGHARAVRLHERVAEASGLPVLGFFLHGEAGGYEYPPALIRDLLALPGALGVKLATLDRAMACQDAIRAAQTTDRLVVTGEDRMFGPSLMWGADTALVGIAAARAELTTAVLDAWRRGDAAEFVRASGRLDRFAEAAFYAPIEGYVQRMHWAAVWEGLVPEAWGHDPYGVGDGFAVGVAAGERGRVVGCLEELGREG